VAAPRRRPVSPAAAGHRAGAVCLAGRPLPMLAGGGGGGRGSRPWLGSHTGSSRASILVFFLRVVYGSCKAVRPSGFSDFAFRRMDGRPVGKERPARSRGYLSLAADHRGWMDHNKESFMRCPPKPRCLVPSADAVDLQVAALAPRRFRQPGLGGLMTVMARGAGGFGLSSDRTHIRSARAVIANGGCSSPRMARRAPTGERPGPGASDRFRGRAGR